MGYLKGGAFLIQETEAKDIFIRSEFGEDQKMMLSATEDFNESLLYPFNAMEDFSHIRAQLQYFF